MQTLDNGVLPAFEAHAAPIDAVLSDNGRELCGRPDTHPCELFLQLEGIEHKTTRLGRPQGIGPPASPDAGSCEHGSAASCSGFPERFHRTLLDEPLCPARRAERYESTAEMRLDLDIRLATCSIGRPRQGRGMNDRTPLQAFLEGLPPSATKAPADDEIAA